MSTRPRRSRKPVQRLVVDPQSNQYVLEDYIVNPEDLEDYKDVEESYELTDVETDSDFTESELEEDVELDDTCFTDLDESDASEFEYLDRVTQECSDTEEDEEEDEEDDEEIELDL